MDTLPNIVMSNDATAADSNSCCNPTTIHCGKYMYNYHRHDVLTRNLQLLSHQLPPDAPCRFLTSKGKGGKKRQLSDATVTIPPQPNHDPMSDRIIIQYPLGATYNLRKSFLFPVIRQDKQIIVAPETDVYRRLCWVHTRPRDCFVEIGCDFGFTLGPVVCHYKLGIDKSKVSIDIAKKNYPRDEFLQVDVLENTVEEMKKILTDRVGEEVLLRVGDVKTIGDGGLVVAIDINGNRELEAVESCLKKVLDCWMPNLVIVKSRSLYAKLIELGA
jgi:hypothetical protein